MKTREKARKDSAIKSVVSMRKKGEGGRPFQQLTTLEPTQPD
jgi:hypothetical protein